MSHFAGCMVEQLFEALGSEHSLLDAKVLKELSELKKINISLTAQFSSQCRQDHDAKLMHIEDLEDRLSFCSIEEERPTRDDEDEDLMHYLMGEAFDDENCDFELMDHV